LSHKIDFKSLEKKLWEEGSGDDPGLRFSSAELPPASIGLASIRIKRWTRILISLSVVFVIASCVLWFSKTHHVLKVSTQNGYVRAVEMFVKDE